MDYQDPLDPLGEDELTGLFRQASRPAPSAGFVARTMNAVRQAPLPEGRKRLRSPLTSLFAWAAVIAGVSLSTVTMLLMHPMFAGAVTRLFSFGVGLGVWLAQFARAGLVVLDVCATTGLAVARASATREGTTGLMLMAVVCAVSIAALHRLLVSEGEESPWQEVS